MCRHGGPEAYKAWADMVVSERVAVLLGAADVLGSKAKEITDVLIEDALGHRI